MTTSIRLPGKKRTSMARRGAALIAGLLLPLGVQADVNGVWKTEAGKDGGYLEVTVAACASDASKFCGTITRAFNQGGEDKGYANLGKLIIKDMSADSGTAFSGGTIWDPEDNKTYKSKMTLKGDELDVEGCVAIICQGQAWRRVK